MQGCLDRKCCHHCVSHVDCFGVEEDRRPSACVRRDTTGIVQKGMTAVEVAMRCGSKKVFTYLLDQGATLDMGAQEQPFGLFES